MTEFKFTHEGVRGITTTDENGETATFIAVTDLTGLMLDRITSELLHLAATMVSADDDAKIEAAQDIFVLDGMGDATTRIHGFALHMESVSERIRAGLPAHPEDTDVEAEVKAFADALAGIEPEDFFD